MKTEYKTAGDAFTVAYRAISEGGKSAKLYKEGGKWYVELSDKQTNKQKGNTK